MNKFLFFFLIFAAALFPLSAKGAREDASAAAPAFQVAAMKGPTGLGMLKLFETPPLLEGGVSTVYTAYAFPDLIVPKMARGEIDIAALPGNLAVNLYNRNADYVLLGILGNGVLYLVSTDPAITSLDALKGKTVQNVAKGSTPEFVVRHILERKGLAADVAVQFRYAHAELAQLLVAGHETCAILPEPFASKVLLARKDARIAADFQKEWAALYPGQPLYPMTVLVAKKALLREQPEALRSFIAEYKKSHTWVLENPSEAGKLAEKFDLGISTADALAAIPRCNLVFIENPAARPLLETFLSIFLESAPEAIGGKLPDSGFYGVP